MARPGRSLDLDRLKEARSKQREKRLSRRTRSEQDSGSWDQGLTQMAGALVPGLAGFAAGLGDDAAGILRLPEAFGTAALGAAGMNNDTTRGILRGIAAISTGGGTEGARLYEQARGRADTPDTTWDRKVDDLAFAREGEGFVDQISSGVTETIPTLRTMLWDSPGQTVNRAATLQGDIAQTVWDRNFDELSTNPYVQAAQQGRLAPLIIEDVGNAAMAGAVVGNAAGAASRAATRGATAQGLPGGVDTAAVARRVAAAPGLEDAARNAGQGLTVPRGPFEQGLRETTANLADPQNAAQAVADITTPPPAATGGGVATLAPPVVAPPVSRLAPLREAVESRLAPHAVDLQNIDQQLGGGVAFANKIADAPLRIPIGATKLVGQGAKKVFPQTYAELAGKASRAANNLATQRDVQSQASRGAAGEGAWFADQAQQLVDDAGQNLTDAQRTAIVLRQGGLDSPEVLNVIRRQRGQAGSVADQQLLEGIAEESGMPQLVDALTPEVVDALDEWRSARRAIDSGDATPEMVEFVSRMDDIAARNAELMDVLAERRRLGIGEQDTPPPEGTPERLQWERNRAQEQGQAPMDSYVERDLARNDEYLAARRVVDEYENPDQVAAKLGDEGDAPQPKATDTDVMEMRLAAEDAFLAKAKAATERLEDSGSAPKGKWPKPPKKVRRVDPITGRTSYVRPGEWDWYQEGTPEAKAYDVWSRNGKRASLSEGTVSIDAIQKYYTAAEGGDIVGGMDADAVMGKILETMVQDQIAQRIRKAGRGSAKGVEAVPYMDDLVEQGYDPARLYEDPLVAREHIDQARLEGASAAGKFDPQEIIDSNAAEGIYDPAEYQYGRAPYQMSRAEVDAETASLMDEMGASTDPARLDAIEARLAELEPEEAARAAREGGWDSAHEYQVERARDAGWPTESGGELTAPRNAAAAAAARDRMAALEAQARSNPKNMPPDLRTVVEFHTQLRNNGMKLVEKQRAAGLDDAANALEADLDALPLELEQILEGDIEPKHVITGQSGPSANPLFSSRKSGSLRKLGSERQRDAGPVGEVSFEKQLTGAVQRYLDGNRNEMSRNMMSKFADTDSVTVARDLTDGSPREVAKMLEDDGLVAVDPSTLRKVSGRNVVLDGPEATQWVPEAVFKAIEDIEAGNAPSVGVAGGWDRATGMWKMSVLPFSPKWNVGNLFGNTLMVASSLSLKEMIDNWGEANDLRKNPNAAVRGMMGEGQAMADLGSELKMADMRRGGKPQSVVGQKLRAAADFSYGINQTIDDFSHLLVYTAKKNEGTAFRKLMLKRLEDGSITPEMYDRAVVMPEKIRDGKAWKPWDDERAIKEALKVGGDFTNLTKFERNTVKRVLPFYPWYRHITRLTLRLPMENPYRTAWALHLADVFTDDEDLPSWLRGSIKIGDNYFRAPFNPYPGGGPTDSPLLNPARAVGAINPLIQMSTGAFGYNLGRARPITMAPGEYALDSEGNRKFASPIGLKNLGGYMINQIPQLRLLAEMKDPGIARYDTRDEIRRSGKPLETSVRGGMWAPLLQFGTGVTVDQPDFKELDRLRTKRLRAAEAADRQYNRGR